MRFRLISFSSVFFLPLFLLLFSANAAENQHESFSLTVNGEVEKPLQLSLSELSKMPRRSVRAQNRDGQECSYQGVELREILLHAGVPSGKELKGK
jgi:DMSO/TMAO reductase YedYZ molybdopterin-dependent catalytic subunit